MTKGRQDRRLERRWIVLAEDGRFVTLGRATDPTEQEIATAEAGLKSQGLAGWLAVMEGNPYVGPLPSVLEVRPLAGPSQPFHDAAAACARTLQEQRRSSSTAS